MTRKISTHLSISKKPKIWYFVNNTTYTICNQTLHDSQKLNNNILCTHREPINKESFWKNKDRRQINHLRKDGVAPFSSVRQVYVPYYHNNIAIPRNLSI